MPTRPIEVRPRPPRSGIGTVVLAALTAVAVARPATTGLAQTSGGEFEIRSSGMNAGGGRMTGASLALHGSVGQAHVEASSGARFELFGGLWTPDETDLLFRDSYEG